MRREGGGGARFGTSDVLSALIFDLGIKENGKRSVNSYVKIFILIVAHIIFFFFKLTLYRSRLPPKTKRNLKKELVKNFFCLRIFVCFHKIRLVLYNTWSTDFFANKNLEYR